MPPSDLCGWTAQTAPASDISVPAVIRLHLTYLWRHRRLLRLANPTLFTEMVQARKLYDRDPRLPQLADKVGVKKFVARRLGAEWVIPTYWHGNVLPEVAPWPRPFVVKARHGCNQREFVRTGQECWATIRRRTELWMQQTYGIWLDEWLYGEIERGLLVEPFVGRGGNLPIDYKLFVFHGRVEFIQVHIDREHAHRWIVMDRQWRRVSPPTQDANPAAPQALKAIVEAAEELGCDIDFVRADFYEVDGSPLFGELTFYPGSGLEPVVPMALDRAMGALWRIK
jgi:TupA-like ATPgrasp